MSDRAREYLSFKGRVQGVGFRYKLLHLAGYYGLTGWVRNEYDGTVSAEIQGQPEEIEMLLAQLQKDRYIRVDELSRERIPELPDENGFRVDY